MSGSETTDSGRNVTLRDATRLAEDTVTLDDELRRDQYRITGGDLVPKAHLGTIDVVDLGDAWSLLVYVSDVEPAEVAEAFDAAMGDAVAALNGYLSQRG